MKRGFHLRCLAALVLLFCFPITCRAHGVHLSGIKMIWERNALTVSVVTPASHLKSDDVKTAIERRLKMRFDGQDFKPLKSTLMLDKANDRATWQTRYEGRVSRIEILSRLYPEDAASQVVATIFRDGRIVQEAILDVRNPSFVIGEDQPRIAPMTVAGRFLRHGVTHIFGGIDHVCFVIGLLLLGGSLRGLLKTITAFTIAHSITLSLAATETYAPSPRIVEPLIALSIVAIALENLRVQNVSRNAAVNIAQRAKKADRRPLFAFVFGLIHGFGFAGALAEVGLPREALGWALGAFNIGVELGQGAIVLVAAPLLARLARRRAALHHHVVAWSSYAIAAAGCFWFMQRVSGS